LVIGGHLPGLQLAALVAPCPRYVAMFALRRMCLSCTRFAQRKYQNYQQLTRLLEGPDGFKFVAMIRLSPFPFGVENALLAMSNITTYRFVVGTTVGLFPNELLFAFLGSKLQDLDDVRYWSIIAT
jgi:uncharacterized membrane protein YdjX (TVP38/TMEM64 family)